MKVNIYDSLLASLEHLDNKIAQFDLSTTFTVLFLAELFVAMLFIRIVPLYHFVFTDWPGSHGNFINFAMDDAVYHMRLVHNTVAHFPHRIFFDPFTHFPYGSMIGWGPFWDLMIAFVAILIGFGHPSAQLVDYVGAYMPALCGALCLIPTYFIAKKLFGKKTALLVAILLTFLPGAFLVRSCIGYADHHVAEVLFSTIMIAFTIYALDEAKNISLSFQQIKAKDFRITRQALIYAALAGVAFGFYLLIWQAALLFGSILFVFFVLQLIFEHVKGRDLDYVIIIAAPIYVLPIFMILPYTYANISMRFDLYSIILPIVLTLLFLTLLAIYLASKLMNKHGINRWLYPLILFLILIVFFGLLYFLDPSFSNMLYTALKMLFHPNSGMLTVSEVWPSIIDRVSGAFTFIVLWRCFFWALPLALLAIIVLCYRVCKHNAPSEVLFLIWNIVMFAALCAQNRFTYYFAVNIALLTGYFTFIAVNYCAEVFKHIKFLQARALPGLKFFSFSFFICLYLLMAVYPLTPKSGESIFYNSGEYRTGVSYEWFDALMWLKNHTPDPQGKMITSSFDYARGFYPLPTNTDQPYPYPSSAYGVMSWWDFGHIMTFIAERIPNANPFQLGILEQNKTAGSALFFTTTDEDAAVQNLNAVGARYVMIDNDMAENKFSAIQLWANDTEHWKELRTVNFDTNQTMTLVYDSSKYHASLTNRLFFQDGDALKHFRLIYESAGSYIVNAKAMNVKTARGDFYMKMISDNYAKLAQVVAEAQQGPKWLDDAKTVFVYDARPPVKMVKVFEKVIGASIIGKAQPRQEVALSLNLVTGDGRMFSYTQQTRANEAGQYEFVVPYSSEPMRGEDYNYDIRAVSHYALKIAAKVRTLNVSEAAVMNGAVIKVN